MNESIINQELVKKIDTGEIDNHQLHNLLLMWPVVKKIGGKIENLARERLNKGQPVGECSLEDGATRRNIVNLKKIFIEMKNDLGVNFDAKAWNNMLSASANDLDKFYAKCAGKKLKEAKEQVKKICGDLIEYKTNKPSLIIK